MRQKRSFAVLGLRLSRQALRVLKERGIYAHAPVSLEHQHLAKRYVVRGMESGGAAGDVGRYVTFAQADGQPVEYLHPVETIGVNGLHAVVVSPVLVRSRNAPQGTYIRTSDHAAPSGRRQRRQATSAWRTKLLFRGIHGRLDLDLSGKDRDRAGFGDCRCFTRWPAKNSRSQSDFTRRSVPSRRR